ncbi:MULTISPECIES: heme-degrading domain-containing protein [unclassified Bifidobacterium]|uniref:heme-degrading domain-containing protein n=1 Tax=Bifidobacterium TaxID=1678 RepID=UPI0028BF3DF7|nr:MULTISPECIES: heme-degrading domain-containing protein [unclassified Bifidobacterium]MDT7510218.1 heme-degrading domain-containing protein [Bifidobacterium sp. H6bp9]MDT7512584.1 heme-degrading domain-containing protein [Bifidobacterium sp. H1HS10N]
MKQISVDAVVKRYNEYKAIFDANEGKLAERKQFIESQEKELRFSDFSVDDAWEVGSAIYAAAHRLQLPVAIDIRLGRQRAFHAAIPGAAEDNDAWAERKGNVVLAYGHASLYVGTDFQQKEEDFDLTSRRNTHDFAAHGGAFPLLLPSGLVFGVTAVSGLPSIYDHSLVTATLKEFVSAQ